MLRAVGRNIIGEVLPPPDKTGSIHLPANRTRHTMNSGEALEVRVTATGPHVQYVQPGMVIMVDPNPSSDRVFEYDNTQYVSVPEDFFSWKEAEGHLFGVYRDE